MPVADGTRTGADLAQATPAPRALRCGLEYGLVFDVGTTAHPAMVLVEQEVAVEGFFGGTVRAGLASSVWLPATTSPHALTGVGSDLGLQADALVGAALN